MEDGATICLEDSTFTCNLVGTYHRLQQVSSQGMDMLEKCSKHPYLAKEELCALCYLVLSDVNCVAVEGCSGSGKTSLLKNLMKLFQRRVGEDVVFLHLGDQIDSKVLLGTYSSTITPGEFVWLPGVLTRAVKNGTWIVLENLDAAPVDVISLLIPLVKNGELIVPGFSEPLKAPHRFKMFCTLRETANLGMMVHTNFLKVFLSHCPIIHLESCTGVELTKILLDEYPGLGVLSDSLVAVCDKFGIHVRHLWKLCERISSQIYDGRIISVNDFMLEVIDCLCASLSTDDKLLRAQKLSFLCGGISDEQIQQLCKSHKPVVQISSSAISVGRAHVPRHSQLPPRVCFAYTQSSLCLLESVCRCVQMNEPVLLVGETGVGKTAVVNYLSQLTGNKLTVFNVCQQTDSSELLGGFKPLETSKLVAPCREEFERLFHLTFSVKDNVQYLSNIQTAFARQKWRKLFKLMTQSVQSALQKLTDKHQKLYQEWKSLHAAIQKFLNGLRGNAASFAFSFSEGALVEAVKNGSWMLLDEINLASAETLQCLSSLLEGPQESFLLPERAELEAVKRHENFRLFCCMNPATDIGKKSLPSPIRNRFTELYVDDLHHSEDLQILIQCYLERFTLDVSVVNGIIRLYRTVYDLAQNKLQDGTGRRPHYSLRNLCRALQFAWDHGDNDILRSLYEGFCISYLSELHGDYHSLILSTIKMCLSITEKTLSYSLPRPPGGKFVLVEGFWLKCGSEPLQDIGGYILTDSVRKNLKNMARVVSARRYPVLLQGPTSAGKTSLIQYLAGQVGQKCVRINNHEHTDLQEYVGTYTADSNGQLVFQEGVLVTAMRNGYWLILDELNLAPTEVLEALNRVLDDNRELFIPETQQLVKAHDQFLLFGTQNPPGIYGGRKVLSRAFRNRFVELHFDDIPSKELETILQQKCQLPPSYSRKMVAVMRDLQERRSASGIFYGKYGLVTLRDLFRWAERYRGAVIQQEYCDWEQHLAEDGYMLLGGRLRDINECQLISEVIKKHFKRDVNDKQLFGFDGSEGGVTTREILKLLHSHSLNEFSHLVWTRELVQMAVLVYRAVQFSEPVLLVGNTGCGKTTICQFLARLLQKDLFSINCHMHTEAADFLGGLRPVRKQSQEKSKSSALFEWSDGVVVKAMKGGGSLLIDEISLAEDAVLERLNSLLEPSRTLVVSENCRSDGDIYQVVAAPEFTFLATMNPSGDYGKKELSPALRNRFVEIWCSTVSTRESCRKIIMHSLDASLTGFTDSPWIDMILDFLVWHSNYMNTPVSIRDILSWIKFINQTVVKLGPESSFYHGACLVFLDGIGCGSGMMEISRSTAERFINSLLNKHGKILRKPAVTTGSEFYGISPFFIERGSETSIELTSYSLKAPGPHLNAFRLLRAMQLGKPLLLEGAPGVGKTSLVTALAQASRHVVVRINLSEHTDINDLFGADLPVEGQQGVHFAWRDGPFLRALKNGHWILLDEMNLASQSVLEGLNACLDHRGEIYIPEIGKYFNVKTGTRIFACQNPLQQGGGRKGLPRSFTNRFTQVFIRVLQPEDHLYIASSLYSDISIQTHQKMITFTSEVQKLVNEECGNGVWEYNLRDILRWCELCQSESVGVVDPGKFVEVIFCSRLRDTVLRRKIVDMCSRIFEVGPEFCFPPKLGSYFSVSKSTVQIGHVVLTSSTYSDFDESHQPLVPLHCQLATLEALAVCVKMNWMAIIVGENSCGKSCAVRTLAQLTGHRLVEFPMNSDTDTTEIVGSFQQVNLSRHYCNVATMCKTVVTGLLNALRSGTAGNTEYKDSLSKMSIEFSNRFSPAMLLESDEEILDTSRKWLVEVLETIQIIAHSCGVLPTGVSETLAVLEDIKSDFLCSEIPGRFEWIDSVLVTAIRQGHWLLISHANFCSPSVLDRLNCLLEPGGYLSIDERGVVGNNVPIVHPHPQFRLFLTMDPIHGELSRAMRNRGIELYMLPSESTVDIKLHKEDLLSILVSTTRLDTKVAHGVLHFSQTLPEMTPSKVLTLARCIASSPGEGDLLKIAKRLQFCKKDTVEMYSRMDNCLVIPSVSDHVLNPAECIVQRDISPIFHCLNDTKRDSFTNKKHGAYLPQLDAAFEIFVSTSTIEDVIVRQDLIHQLLRLLENEEYRTLECLVYLHTLKDHQQWACSFRPSCEVSNLIPGTNPIVVHNLQDLIGLLRLHSIVVLKYLDQQVKLRDHKSLLLVSKDAFEGRYPVDCLEHSSLVYLYSYIGTALQAVLDISTNCDTLNTSVSLEIVLGWLRIFVQACMMPSMTLQRIACSWTLIQPKTFLNFLPLLQTASQWQYLLTLADKLYPLEEMTVNSRMYDAIRQVMSCSARLSEAELYHMSQIIRKDAEAMQKVKKMPPFLMLYDSDYSKRKCLLSNWMNSNQFKESVDDNYDVCGLPSILSLSDKVLSMSAIYPAVYLLKYLLLNPSSDVHVLASHLLKYAQRLSFVTIRELKPLVDFASQKSAADSKHISLLNCVSSAYGLLVNIYLTDNVYTVHHSLSESICSVFCFHHLAPQPQAGDAFFPRLESSSLHSLGNYSVKMEELQNLSQYLWINTNSPVFNIQQNWYMNLKYLKDMLRNFVLAILEVGFSRGEPTYVDEIAPENVTAACAAIRALMPVEDDPNFWEVVQRELLASLEAIKKAEFSVYQCDDVSDIDLTLLETTSIAKIHLGLAMGLVLCPPLVDPLTISATEHHFLCSIVEHYSALTDAWNKYYMNMTGKKLSDLYNTSNISPEFLCMPSCLKLLLMVKDAFKKRQDNNKLASSVYINDKKYSSFSAMCADMMKTVCNHTKLHSMLADIGLNSNPNTTMNKLTAISKALALFVHRIQSEFQEYSDIAEPFLLATFQIFEGVSSLIAQKAQKWKELHDTAIAIAQYPIGTCFATSIFEWIMMLLKSTQSGMDSSTENSPLQVIHKKLLLIGVKAGIQRCEWGPLRLSQIQGFSNLLKYCWSIWRKEDDARRKKAAEEDSLYIFKAKTHHILSSELDEAQKLEAEIFPLYDGEDATDQHQDDKSPEHLESFSVEDLYHVCKLHLSLFGIESQDRALEHQPPLETYHVASYLVHCLQTLPGYNADNLLAGANIRMCHHHIKSLHTNLVVHSRQFNIYKHPAPTEATAAVPVLNSLKERTKELLKEWPDHPLLNQIVVAVNKVLSLDITEPLMKILSGMEYIMRRAQDWEAYASSHVSLSQQLESLMCLVLHWRKLELSCWKNLFSICEHELEMKSSNLWVYLYELCHAKIGQEEETSLNLADLWDALVKFMEASCVGDFELRLKMIKSFHMEMTTVEKMQLSNLLGNIYHYYMQFTSIVLKSTEVSLIPLEKELKEFLEVSRWNDGSYWTIKESSETNHKKLLKFMSKYRAALNQPVKPLLGVTVSGDTAISTSSVVQPMCHCLKGLQFLTDQSQHESIILLLPSNDNTDLELATEDVHYRLRNFVKEFVSQDVCLTLGDLVDNLSERSSQVKHNLQSEEFLKGVEQKKRKAAIKLNKSLKQNALGALFKSLKNGGMSYRRGAEFSMEKILQLSVVKIPSELADVNQAQLVIDSCYYGCITEVATMVQAFIHPSKDLTVGQIARCKGFVNHLLSTVCEQRPLLSEALQQLCMLKQYASTWQMVQIRPQLIIAQEEFCHWQSCLCYCVELCLESIASLSNLFRFTPTEIDLSFSPLPEELLPPIITCKDFSVGEKAQMLLKGHQEQLKDLHIKLIEQEQRKWAHFYTFGEVDDLREGFELVKCFSESASASLTMMLGSCSSDGVFLFLRKLCSKLDNECSLFLCWMNSMQQCEHPVIHKGKDCRQQSSSLVGHILVCVQRVMLRHNSFRATGDVDFEYCKNLHKISSRNFSDIQLKETLDLMEQVLIESSANCTESWTSILRAVYPLLNQYYLLCKKLLTDLLIAHIKLCQLLSILAQTFSVLATKGFSTVSEEESTNETDETDLVDVEAGGFDSGQGSKNVSNSTEADNLDINDEDVANKAEDPCEHDVEVTDDFEGNLENVGEESQEDLSDEDEDDEKETEDVQIGNLGSDLPNHIDRKMWTEEDKDNLEGNDSQSNEDGGGTAMNEQTEIVANDDLIREHSFDDPQAKGDDKRCADELKNQFDSAEMESLTSCDEDENSTADFGDMSIDGADDQACSDGQSQSDADVNGEHIEEDSGGIQDQVNIASDEAQQAQESNAWSVDQSGNEEAKQDTIVNKADSNSTYTETTQVHSIGDTEAPSVGGPASDTLASVQEGHGLSQKSRLHRSIQRHNDCSAQDYDIKFEAKRQRIMDTNEEISVNHKKQESSTYQHIHNSQQSEDYDFAWDSAMHEQHASSVPPPLEDPLFYSGATEYLQVESVDETCLNLAKGESVQQVVNTGDEMNTGGVAYGDFSDSARLRKLDTFFSSGDMLYPRQFKIDDKLRHYLMTTVNNLQEKQGSDGPRQDAYYRLWLKYEVLVFDISQALYEALRLVLLPTKASQLKGDYRSGKRLNMRRIIPYIASNFQNDQIWLRRTKPTQREYQVLVAVDDSSSMHENQCKEMAYESLAVISCALSRLNCGQLGVCRFGVSVEVLHCLEKPFSATSGGFILQHLVFDQARTNFVELLQTAYAIFGSNLQTRSGSQPEISQLLLILSDGRGVFADGVQSVQATIRRLNDIGVFTVFVILDSLSKDSVVDIKVPSFIPGKPPVIHNYLEQFPFSFYIVLRDVKKMPVVLGQAIHQWFELITSRS